MDFNSFKCLNHSNVTFGISHGNSIDFIIVVIINVSVPLYWELETTDADESDSYNHSIKIMYVWQSMEKPVKSWYIYPLMKFWKY